MPQRSPAVQGTDVLLALVAGVVGCIGFVLISLTLLSSFVLNEEEQSAQRLLETVEHAIVEGSGILGRLNALNSQECTEDLLTLMRKELFLASYINEIGFVSDGHLICSTSLNQLDTPYRQQPWDYIDKAGNRLWTQASLVLFDELISAPMAQRGNFNVVFDTSRIRNLITPPFRWQLVFVPGNDRYEHTEGQEGIYRGLGEDRMAATLTTHYAEACSTRYAYCAAVEADNLTLLARNIAFPLLLIVAGIGLGLGVTGMTFLGLQRRFSLTSRVRRGLQHGHFYPVYQPVVNLHSNRIGGCEVLARFRDSHGELQPHEFVPEIYRQQRSWQFTVQIVGQALRELASHIAIPDSFKVNINLYPGDISSGEVRKLSIMPWLTETRLKLAFEITEDQQLDSAASKESLDWLRQKGFEIAIDDFGTGYSNFSEVRDLNCTALKIDKSFITDIEHGGVRTTIVPLVIKIARELQLAVIIEGIENAEQAAIVKTMGADYGQGWHYGKPMTSSELEQLLVSSALTP